MLVLESGRGGLLTLLAHSAVSDLAGIDRPVHVDTAIGPEQGIEALRTAPHQCVVVDLGLPDASAFAFLDRLQTDPELRDVPVLAHTRDKPDSAQARLARLRFGSESLELLPSLDELRERITLHLSAARPEHVPAPIGEQAEGGTRVPSPETRGHEALRGRRVLVIDDDARNVFAITSTLELHGMTVTRAPNGRRGIEALLSANGTDLILMDVMMPELDGYATMTKIRQMPTFPSSREPGARRRQDRGARHERRGPAAAGGHESKPTSQKRPGSERDGGALRRRAGKQTEWDGTARRP